MEHSTLPVNPARCYQCGKCSAGCALNTYMDYPPSVVMRLLQTGDEKDLERVLRSEAIWLCAACQQCVTRCPQQIDIPALMDQLRVTALEKKMVNKRSKNVVAFHRAFLDSVRLTGRLYEVGLVADYKLRTMELLQDLDVAPRMYVKGKLPLLPERIKNRKQFSKLWK